MGKLAIKLVIKIFVLQSDRQLGYLILLTFAIPELLLPPWPAPLPFPMPPPPPGHVPSLPPVLLSPSLPALSVVSSVLVAQ